MFKAPVEKYPASDPAKLNMTGGRNRSCPRPPNDCGAQCIALDNLSRKDTDDRSRLAQFDYLENIKTVGDISSSDMEDDLDEELVDGDIESLNLSDPDLFGLDISPAAPDLGERIASDEHVRDLPDIDGGCALESSSELKPLGSVDRLTQSTDISLASLEHLCHNKHNEVPERGVNNVATFVKQNDVEKASQNDFRPAGYDVKQSVCNISGLTRNGPVQTPKSLLPKLGQTRQRQWDVTRSKFPGVLNVSLKQLGRVNGFLSVLIVVVCVSAISFLFYYMLRCDD